ncbi:CHAD domain-containing protein [Aurantimonas sp. MSK8Z-1]|uniref:CHAD domain-containing protein n=1 Tax=Mangrovibrevibacter kandeliae TaxID=2968473 RepID=UPI00211781A2|nr:CHAD domain-containing protein [Aurantimonas sp. MSK8Z-1]MCW4115702.1 CHAD domain-containing protein [Aurantimonas sp. MSK8Z-1]
MSYRIDPAQPLDHEIRRIAGKQIEAALDELTGEASDRHEAIHEARKRFKKLRGLLRLARTADKRFFRRANRQLREAAGQLSGTRDRAALIESLDALSAHHRSEVDAAVFAPVREVLVARRDAAVAAETDLAVTLDAVTGELRDVRTRLDGFVLPDGPKSSGAIAARGFALNLARGRSDLATARKSERAEAYHDLRKRAKYHWMHLKLLEPLWPEVFTATARQADRLGDALGLDHDYAVLRGEIALEPGAFGPERELSIVLALIDRRQGELRAEALDLAGRLFLDKESVAERRIRKLWQAAAERANAPDLGKPAEEARALDPA